MKIGFRTTQLVKAFVQRLRIANSGPYALAQRPVAVVTALLLALLATPAAFAYSNQWEWNVYDVPPGFCTGSFPTKQAAIACVRTINAKYALLDKETDLGTDGQWQSYRLSAEPKQIQPNAWLYGMSVRVHETEELAVQEATAQFQAAPGGPCPSNPVSYPNGDWTRQGGTSYGVSYFEKRDYKVSGIRGTAYYGTPYQVCIDLSDGSYPLYRERTFSCPIHYKIQSPAPWCWINETARILGRALDVCTAGAAATTKVGNPCDATTGNKVQIDTDVTLPGITFRRSYNSITLDSSKRMGTGWRHDFERSLVFDGTTPKSIVNANGSSETLTYAATNTYVGREGSGLVVKKVGTDWRLYRNDGSYDVYSASGRLVSVNDHGRLTVLGYNLNDLELISGPFGHNIAIEYDVNKRVGSIRLPGNQTISFDYSPSTGSLIRVTYPSGQFRQYHYEDAAFPNALTGITDESGERFATFGYDELGRAVLTEHAGGVDRYTLAYTQANTVVTDPLGTTMTYTFASYPAMSRRVSSFARGGAVRAASFAAWAQDNQRRPLSINDERGMVTAYARTAYHTTSITEATGTLRARTRSFQYLNTDADLPTQIDEPGKRSTFTYDANGNVLTKTETDTTLNVSRTWTYTYNTFGQVLTADGPRTDVNDITTYTYYSCNSGYQCGQVQTITNALGQITSYNTYNAHGQPLTITDPNGLVTTLTYDLRQRLTSRTVGAEVTSFEYWPTGLLKKATLPDSTYIDYAYDPAHRLIGISDSEGNRISYTLDAMGNRTREDVYDSSNALTNTRSRIFNTLNRLQQELTAGNIATTFVYDNNGNQTGVNAPLGRNSSNTYDELNRLTQVTDPSNGVTRYAYNALDQLISVTDPRNKATNYTYNALGDLVQQISPDTGATTNTYDSAGNLKTSTDARSKTATYSYDALNRVSQLSYPDQTIAYQYDTGANALGRLSALTDNSGQTQFGYDPQGRVIARTQSMGVLKQVSYSYDSGGRIASVTLPSGHFVQYGYTNGKVTSLTLDGVTPILSNVLYEPFGPTRGWTWGNGTLAVRDFDQDGKVTLIDSAGLNTYSYDNAFRITGITDTTDPAQSQSYGYDLLDRLTTATGSALNQSFTYDANGNRLTQGGSTASTYSVSTTNNRVNSVSGALAKTYSYDNAGNTIGDGARTFTYNDAGRMTSVTVGGVTTTYTLNGLGQRVKKTSNTGTTYFVYDEAGHLTGEYDANGAMVQELVWFGDTPVATLRPNGSGVELSYIHTDHLNTPRKITRPSDNQLRWTWNPDPFGNGVPNQNPAGMGSFVFNQRFPGQYFDSETSLHYNYYRDGYDSATGRYTQSDPIGLAGGVNTYAYVSNPISAIDPLGLFRVRAWEYYDGHLEFEFEFEAGCIAGFVKENVGGPFRWIKRAVKAKKSFAGDNFSGSNDVGGEAAKCTCRNYDDGLKQYFTGRGFESSAGAMRGGTGFNEADARAMINDLRREMKRLRKDQCSTDDCPQDETLYPWNQLIDLAIDRKIPYIGNLIPH